MFRVPLIRFQGTYTESTEKLVPCKMNKTISTFLQNMPSTCSTLKKHLKKSLEIKEKHCWICIKPISPCYVHTTSKSLVSNCQFLHKTASKKLPVTASPTISTMSQKYPRYRLSVTANIYEDRPASILRSSQQHNYVRFSW